jgi:hypothetical protein
VVVRDRDGMRFWERERKDLTGLMLPLRRFYYWVVQGRGESGAFRINVLMVIIAS